MADAQAKTQEERNREREERRRLNARQRRARRMRERERRRAARPAEESAAERVDGAGDERHGRGRPRVRQGVVVSDRAPKTLVVRIDTRRQHRVYKKTVRESSTLHAHDERDEARVGDTVRVVESRPLSATKRWRLIEVVERAR